MTSPKSACAILPLFLVACAPDTVEDAEAIGDENEDSGGECAVLVWTGDGSSTVLHITSSEQAATLPLYTRIDGSLRVEAPGVTDLRFLKCVEEVRGYVSIRANPDLESLDGLERLTTLSPPSIEYAAFGIRENPVLEDINGLVGLEVLPRLAIVDNPILESTAGLSNLRHADEIDIQRNQALVTVELPSLESVNLLTIGTWSCPNWDPDLEPTPTPTPDGNASLVHLDGLSSLQTYGELQIIGNPLLESVAGLLSASGDRVDVELNPALPYAQAIELDASVLTTCGNLDDPNSCECYFGPGGP